MNITLNEFIDGSGSHDREASRRRRETEIEGNGIWSRRVMMIKDMW
jgi:hypothetical protein